MLSLYCHIPFCVKKCSYCGFYSTPYSFQSASDFLFGLKLEASRYKNDFAGHRIGSVYIGGGTPTAFSQEELAHLFTVLREHFSYA